MRIITSLMARGVLVYIFKVNNNTVFSVFKIRNGVLVYIFKVNNNPSKSVQKLLEGV